MVSQSVSSLQVSAASSMLRATLDYADLPPSARVAWIVYYRADSDSEWLQRTVRFFAQRPLPSIMIAI